VTGHPAARSARAANARDCAGLTRSLSASAERLLIGASVYREPAERNALLFQVGLHDWTASGAPGLQGGPPYQEPADLDDMIAACEAAGLLTVRYVAPEGRSGPGRSDLPTVFVDRWTASELHRALEAAGRGRDLADAHLRAAGYWQWRSSAWLQDRRADLHDLLEARHHLLKAGETQQACELTAAVCSQLHAWGDLGREAALISDTLTWLPAGSALSAAWIHELGTIAQLRSDYAEAERCYKRALDIFADVGDLSGVSRSYHSLGVLAQAQGDYTRAELRYQAAETAGSPPAVPAPAPAEPASPAPPQAPAPAEPSNAAPPQAPAPAGPSSPAPPPQGSVPAEPSNAAPPQAAAAAEPPIPAPPPQGPAPAGPSSPAPPPQGSVPAEPSNAAPPQTTGPAGPKHASAFARPGRPTWWRMPGLTAVSVALLALSAAGITGVFPSAGGASLPTSGAMTAAAAVSQAAAAWVAGQVSHSAIVSCDPAMCTELQAHGVPAGDLLVLGTAAPDPLGSDVVVATTALRSEFGDRLADVYAPVVLASFGSGAGRVDVRVVAPDGAAAYRNALAADVAARTNAGSQLLGNPRLTVPAPARWQLTEGLVDSRLLATLATLTDMYPVRIVSFGEPARGASAGVPLRSVEIAASTAAMSRGHGTARASVAYVRSVVGFLRAQQPPFLATDIRAIQIRGRVAVILVGFASPSPLGLLSRSPAM
jgi:tetratricopeptide (TPR) repeat protein